MRHDEGFDVSYPGNERLGLVRHLFSLVRETYSRFSRGRRFCFLFLSRFLL